MRCGGCGGRVFVSVQYDVFFPCFIGGDKHKSVQSVELGWGIDMSDKKVTMLLNYSVVVD